MYKIYTIMTTSVIKVVYEKYMKMGIKKKKSTY